MSEKTILKFVETDTLPVLAIEYEGVDLTGYTITLRVETSPVLAKTASITNPECGLFEFSFTATDLPAGSWPAQIEVIDDSGGQLTIDGLEIRVGEKI